jgi:hypothetical protein
MMAFGRRIPGLERGLALLLVLGACSPAEPADTGAAPMSRTTDPIALFAASASPGAEGNVVSGAGQPVRVRLVRAYAAASGRECREVTVSRQAAGPRLLCRIAGDLARGAAPAQREASGRP